MNFLPKDYNIPAEEGGYMRFKKGENLFRILASPIIGWETWEDTKEGRRPIRKRMDDPFVVNDVDPEEVKHFWAMPVWNYTAKRVQILEITQKTIQKVIKQLARQKAWGSPLGYDIDVIREGEGMETRYNVVPSPPKDLDPEIDKVFKAMTLNIEALYDGDDPFADNFDAAEEVFADSEPIK